MKPHISQLHSLRLFCRLAAESTLPENPKVTQHAEADDTPLFVLSFTSQGPLEPTALAATMLSLTDKERRSIEATTPAALKTASTNERAVSSSPGSPVSPKTARSRRSTQATARGLSATSSLSQSFPGASGDGSAYSVASVSSVIEEGERRSRRSVGGVLQAVKEESRSRGVEESRSRGGVEESAH